MSSMIPAQATNARPQSIGSPLAAHGATLALIGRLGASKVLDCPAGRGAFAWQLRQSGVDVTCADIDPAQFELEGPYSFANLNVTVPYADGQFDAVTCQNGLHHVWARGRAVGGLARVTKPGGRVVFTFLNNNIGRCLMYMPSGSIIHLINVPLHNFYSEARNPAAHYRPMTAVQVVSSMRSAGLEVTGLSAFDWSGKALLLAALAVRPTLVVQPSGFFGPSSVRLPRRRQRLPRAVRRLPHRVLQEGWRHVAGRRRRDSVVMPADVCTWMARALPARRLRAR